MNKGTKIAVLFGATLLLLVAVGCVGAKYKALLPSIEGDPGACMWVVAIRDNATDSRLFWCCSEGGNPQCTEASFEELGERQLQGPFRSGKPSVP